ncbi:1-deoxy-D-xylulose-5-phosphate synthase [candidate division KSB1 bacterium]
MVVDLNKLNSPEDLKKLPLEDLPELARQIREKLISVVSKTGGHLAPSLGVVELTIALHYVLSAPRDRIIWDVGHQSYAHKLLTGRGPLFNYLRQVDGISGFPKKDESPYDSFGTGHASTSISSGLGIACARDRKGEDFKVVSVIGDGALTGGLAYEGLNQAGALGADLMVVLNDNEMSISRNVGALARYLTNLIRNPLYNRLRNQIWEITGKMHDIGGRIRGMAKRLEESFKGLITPGMWFEELGFRYFGPVDGHDLDGLVDLFGDLKDLHGPLLVHVLTRKGKGYAPAESETSRFHGIGPFNIKTGKDSSRPAVSTYADIFGETLLELARDKPQLVAVTAAMIDNTGLRPFAQEMPDRLYDVGIAESHAVTFAAGLASEGLSPVVAIYSTFLQRAFDQIIHDVALQKLPVRFVLDRGGLVGEDGPTHHGAFDLSYLRLVPGMVVMAPRDEAELRHMLKTAVEYNDGPIALRFPRGAGLGVPVNGPMRTLTIGQAEVLNDGDHVSIWAVGSMVKIALEARRELEREGISARVVDARFVKPLDAKLLAEDAGRFDMIVTVEENARVGGFGSAVLEWASENDLSPGRVLNVSLPDRFVGQGTRSYLMNKLGIDSSGLTGRVTSALNRAHVSI